MTGQVSNAFIQQYDADVFVAFQRQGSKMLSATRLKDRLNGQTVTFQKVGKGTATQKSRNGSVPVMNQNHTPVACNVADFYAGDWVDKLDELKINIDERMVVASGGAYALGRQVDSQINTAARLALPAGQKVAVAASGLTRPKILQATELLNNADVPDDGNRFAFVGAHQWNELLGILEFKSSDFVGKEYPWLNSTDVKRWNSLVWVRHTGLDLVATTRFCMFWHKSCLGYARGQEINTDITWHGDRASHFVNSMMSGGAVRIEDTGVVEVACDDTTAYA